jgi:hypothetical protein
MGKPPKGMRCHKHFPRVHFKSRGRAGCLLGTPMAGRPLAPKQQWGEVVFHRTKSP